MLVVGELDMELNELLEEEAVITIIIDLDLSLRDVGRMSTHDWIGESVHFDPTLKSLLASCVFHEGDSKLLLDN